MKKIILIFALILLIPTAVLAQSSAFSFQGRLNDGTNPANGRYDLEFKLFNAITGGTLIGVVVSRPNTILINGVFSTTLDFGAAAFNNNPNLFIEIAVRPNGSTNALTILGPRQQITAVPFAIRAISAANADNSTNAQNAFNAQNAVNSTNATNATNATTAATATNALSLGGVAPAGWARLNVPNNGDLIANGRLQLTGNATQLSTSNGLVKAMVYVNANATIIRCFNGITNTSSGNCGFSATKATQFGGLYTVNFNFPLNDRFVSVTPETSGGSVNIGATFRLDGTFNSSIFVTTFITDVTWVNSSADNPFIIIVY